MVQSGREDGGHQARGWYHLSTVLDDYSRLSSYAVESGYVGRWRKADPQRCDLIHGYTAYKGDSSTQDLTNKGPCYFSKSRATNLRK